MAVLTADRYRELRLGGRSELTRAMLYGGDQRQQAALDGLARLKCPELAEEYARLAGDAYPIATRLRAARALLTVGDTSGGRLVIDVALKDEFDDGVTLQDVIFALEDLHHYATADVVTVLRDQLRRSEGMNEGFLLTGQTEELRRSEGWNNRLLLTPRTKALGRYGPSTAPLLVEMLQETDAPAHYRVAAAIALGEAGDIASVDALLEATSDPHTKLALSALKSAAAIGGESIAARLVPLIDTRDFLNAYLLYYFSNFRHPTAKAKLEEYLSTTTAPWLRERIKKAVLFQSTKHK